MSMSLFEHRLLKVTADLPNQGMQDPTQSSSVPPWQRNACFWNEGGNNK